MVCNTYNKMKSLMKILYNITSVYNYLFNVFLYCNVTDKTCNIITKKPI